MKIIEKKNKKYNVGLAHGVFDILHIGHIEYFRKAKTLCNKLLVSVTEDKFVNKGPNRPAFSTSERVRMLNSIKYIDQVIVSKNFSAVKIINQLKPDIYFKGKDYKNLIKNPNRNLKLEINAVKKNKGKFFIIDTKLKSSSKILNENFNYLDKEVINFLKKINKQNFGEKLKEYLFKISNKKILIIGEPIIDIHCNVNVLGKSQKSNVVSTNFVKNEEFGGGSILAANFMREFFEKVDLLAFINSDNIKLFNKFLNKKINLKKISSETERIIKKKRFVDEYSKNKLFQINHNEKYKLSDKNENLYFNKLKKIIKNYDELVIFDYGYGYMFDKNLRLFKKYPNKININCQTNSSNFGFNLISKYYNGNIASVDEVEFRLCVKNKNEPILSLIKKNKEIINRFKIFIITMGIKGCYIVHKNKVFYIPTVFKNTFDTTGCGDIFFSTFVFFNSLKKFGIYELGLLSHIAAGMHANYQGNKNLINKNNLFQIIQAVVK